MTKNTDTEDMFVMDGEIFDFPCFIKIRVIRKPDSRRISTKFHDLSTFQSFKTFFDKKEMVLQQEYIVPILITQMSRNSLIKTAGISGDKVILMGLEPTTT